MSNPLLSIVTVTYRDAAGLGATISSLHELRRIMGQEVEFIIVDGGTGQEFWDAVASLSGSFRTLSEADQGVYDAMNKGLSLSQGHFVWFLNGGDVCTVTDVAGFAKFLKDSIGSMVLADYSLDTGSRRIQRRQRSAEYIWHGLPTSHQAILYPGELARSHRYDLSYKVVGDYEFTARLLASGVVTRQMPQNIAAFQLGGMSQLHAKTVAVEATRVQRTVLGLPWYRQAHSRVRHTVSRNIRRLQARF